ncbi:hypothetical protein D3C72_1956910 [compost metagenome]
MVRSWPSNSTLPCVALITPHRVLSVVVLPAPLAPIRVTISPARTSKFRPLSTWLLP